MAATFFWRCESTTFDGTHDHSDGDSTPTAAGFDESISAAQAFQGTNSVLAAGFAGYYQFDLASIADYTEGCCSFAFRTDNWSAGELFIVLLEAAADNNWIVVSLLGTTGSGNVRAQIKQDGADSTNVDTTGLNLANDTWYSAVVRWDQAATTLTLSIYDATGSQIGSDAESTSVGGTSWPTGADIFRTGPQGGGSGENVWIDNVLYGDAYDDPLESNLDIASWTEYSTGSGPSGPVAGSLGMLGVGI